ncbi:hypothetical protein K440DRAFT_120725 [Wilcoxina mikolae CBS 423.85]|nr:hypothetical protein K440DRAFT_120725 [Wilcoxina mikolae CBS 423.85]
MTHMQLPQMESKPVKRVDAAAAFQHILTLPSSAAAQNAIKEKRSYKCGHCNTTFRRSEHCIRHERSHTLEKPFGCSVCGCHFSRKDLLVRHERTVHSTNRRPSTSRPTKRQRTADSEEHTISRPSPTVLLSDRRNSSGENIELNFRAIPGGNDYFSSISPETSSPGSVQQNARRGSLLSIPEGIEPPTPPESDLSDHGLRIDNRAADEEGSGDIELGELPSDIDFSILFPNVNSKPNSEDGCSPMEPGFPSVSPDVHNIFGARSHHFAEFQGFNRILEDAPQEMGGLFQDVVVDGRYQSGMAPVEEFILPQSPLTRQRERRGTAGSEASNQSFSKSLSQKPATGFIIDYATREWILQDLSVSHPRDLLTDFCLPNSTTLQRYLDSYFNSFHKNFPILHLPTFHLKGTKALLLLAVCCIGAQYCLEKRRARYLFEWTKRFLAIEDVRWKRVEVERKAWLVRSKLLLGFFGIWSAERELVSDVISEQGWFASFFRSAQALLLRREETPLQQQTWRDWVDIEGFKRICYGIFILQSHITITFNLSPALSCTEIQLPLLASEELWQSADAESWDALLPFNLTPDPKFNEALECHFGARAPMEALMPPLQHGPSAFGGLTLVHGLLSQQWQISQCRQSLNLFGFTTPAISPFTMAQESENLLGRLQKCLIYTHQNISDSAGGSLWFCASGLLRQAYIRQFTQFEPASVKMRTIMRPDEASLDVEGVVGYVLSGTDRSAAVTRAAEKATETLEMPIRAGHVMVRKTAALNWSVDHVISGWDCSKFLSPGRQCTDILSKWR